MLPKAVFCKHSRRWRLLLTLTLLIAPVLSLLQVTPAKAAFGWQIETVDSMGLVGQENSLALDSSDRPVISYLDRTNFDLKVVHCGDLTCTSGNQISTVDSTGMVGSATSLRLDSAGKPVISYFDLTNAQLKVAHCGDVNCTSGNSIVTVDHTAGVGSATALALDSTGKPIIVYRDDTNGDLKVAHCGDANCTSGNSIVTVDSTGDVGYNPSLQLDSNGYPVISYYDATNGDLKVLHCGNANCTTNNSIVTVDSDGNVGGFSSLALDGSDYPIISYYGNSNLSVAYCSDANCFGPKNISTVESAGDVGGDNALVLGTNGKSVISYYDATNEDLRFMLCGNAGCYLNGSSATVDSVGSVGQATALALDSNGKPVISYWDRTNDDLKLARLVGDDPTPPRINPMTIGNPGNNGWYVSDVTTSWSIWEEESTISAQTGCTPTTITSDSSSVTLTCSVTSAGGSSSQSVTLKRDATAPVVMVTGVTDGTTYTLGSVPPAGCNTSDGLSGVATPATLTLTGGGGDGTGSFTATCGGATDLAGNQAAGISVAYTVNSPSTPTPTTTSLPTPTNTPEPTPTSTSSPEPTNTPEPTATPGGTLIGTCGPYAVYQHGTTYTAAGWAGTIKVGTNSNNTLTGTNGPDLLLGLGGNDLLKGNDGADLLCGGDGIDLVQGLAGHDYLDGGSGSDVLNGGSGDYDELLGGDGNDVLLDGDGVNNASGGAGNDLFTLALRNGWRAATGQARFTGLSGGYGNDTVGLVILNPAQFFVDITGDERDNPASSLEGTNDTLALVGVIHPSSTLLKFEQQVVLSATSEAIIPGEESGAEYLTEPVGEESTPPIEQANRLFLPLVNR